MNNCTHQDGLSIQASANYLADSGRWMVDVTAACVTCLEPFRWLGLNAGVAFGYPMTSPDGLELRAPMEPQSLQLQREARAPSAMRYVLQIETVTQETGRGPQTFRTLAVAHDQWHLGAGCEDVINRMSDYQTKPAVPAGFALCPRCFEAGAAASANAQYSAEPFVSFEAPLGGHQPEARPATATTAPAPQPAVLAPEEPPPAQDTPPAPQPAVLATSASPVAPLAPEPGDDEEDEKPTASGKGAQAAVFLAPDTGGDGGDAPLGQVVARERGGRQPRGGRR